MRRKYLPSPGQIMMLSALGIDEITGRQLAAQFELAYESPIPFGTLYPQLQRLQGRGLIAIRPAREGDRRNKFFKLTPAGQRLLPKILAVAIAIDALERELEVAAKSGKC